MEKPSTGYEIKSLMQRSTAYFWRESDSTIYPMLKVLAQEGSVTSETAYVGKKAKEIFTITDQGRKEFKLWLKNPTSSETPRNEFLLKLFFITEKKDMDRLFDERLNKMKQIYEEYLQIKERIESAPDSRRKTVRLKSLEYGLIHLELEIKWLEKQLQITL